MTAGRPIQGFVPTRRRLVPAVLLAPVLAAMVACSGSDTNDGAAATTAPTTSTPTTGGSEGPTTSVPAPASTTPGPPVTRGPQSFTFGPVTFHIPAAWITVPEGGTTVYIGENAGRTGSANLRVMTGYTGTVDALQPAACKGDADEHSRPPASVELLDSGFAPVGNVTAEYRRWRFSCPEAQMKVEEHRVWLLPVSEVAIVEQRHGAPVTDIVATAEVA